MCQKNVGRLDAFLRIAAGTISVSIGIMRDRPSLATLGALKVASGITRYCPIYDVLNIHTISDEELFEDLGVDFEDAEIYDEEEFDGQDCSCGCHESEAAQGTGPSGRRHYTHRAKKRNQYVSLF
ncbi:MAG: DUF2892 domain-containing protein [Turicibacter sp.]|nr:DUF2892 domain-containing protein [Turicibacter sp.]